MKRFAFLLSAAAFCSLCFLHPSVRGADPDPFTPFLGEWDNVDPNTGGVTRIEVVREANKLTVRAWGRCHPAECEWGDADGVPLVDDVAYLHVLWNMSFKEEAHKLTMTPKGLLKLESDVHFTDESGRKDQEHVYQFRRGWSQNWSDEPTSNR